MPLRLLSAHDVRRALPMREAIEAMRGAFRALHAGTAQMPVRAQLATERGTQLFMPAYLPGIGLGQKAVAVFAGNGERGLPTIHALVTLFDPETGVPLALIEGSTLTALRTGAVTGLAAELLAPPDARVLTIFGAGGQAALQIEALCAVRPIEEIWIASRSDSAARLAERLQQEDGSRRYRAARDPQEATERADVVIAVTTATEPVLDARWVRPGALVCGVGSYRPDMVEIDPLLMRDAWVVVDQIEAARAEAGELIAAVERGLWSWGAVGSELGALVANESAPPDGVTRYFKSCGLAVEDIAAAAAVLATAERDGVGQLVAI